MSRPVIAVVTGFTKNAVLCERSFAPLRALRGAGVIQRILYVTWDMSALDEYAAPVARMGDVEMLRVPEPQDTGAPCQKGVVCQIRNLEAALAHIDEPDALIVKLRPDLVADTQFLAGKIVDFDRLCAPSLPGARLSPPLPPSPFQAKIWLPWADATLPFFYEDAAFIGLKADIARLADRGAESHLGVTANKACGWFAHIVRFAHVFAHDYPMFQRYMREFRYFPNDLEYRMALSTMLMDDAFYWHLLIAHAWILATSFHVDCGKPGQIALYTNTSNPQADWSRLESLNLNTPYDNIEAWRAGHKPGGVLPGAARAYGRLMDDGWQHALFTAPSLRDLPPAQIDGILRNVALYSRGFLANSEDTYYRRLDAFWQRHWNCAAA